MSGLYWVKTTSLAFIGHPPWFKAIDSDWQTLRAAIQSGYNMENGMIETGDQVRNGLPQIPQSPTQLESRISKAAELRPDHGFPCQNQPLAFGRGV
jgi:hypothetical protein